MSPEAPTLSLRSRLLDLHSGMFEAFLHPDDAARLSLHPLDRVRLESPAEGKDSPAIVNLSPALVAVGEVGLSVEAAKRLAATDGQPIVVRATTKPRSVESIRAKLDGHRLSPDQIRRIIVDIAHGDLTNIELTAWACAVQVHGMDTDETVACVEAMVDTGERIQFNGTVVDVHSIGGVPGNTYAPIAVPIVACHGILIPKTSSRAISSACGTADLMETLCPVALPADEVRRVVETTGGCLAWGGGVNLAPADDEIIRVEYPLSLDPPSQLLASVLSKKLAVGARDVLIDIPVGGKVPTEGEARHLARDFIAVGERLGMRIQVLLSQGTRPVGRAIGPILEAREALQTLEQGADAGGLAEKALILAGRLLEMGKAAEPGQGHALAKETLADGRALAKFKAIIEAQGGVPVPSTQLQPGAYHQDLHAPQAGHIRGVDNRALTQVARAAGSPRDKGAGLVIHVEPGDRVQDDDVMYTVYAESRSRLRDAVALARTLRPFLLEGGQAYGFIDA